MAGEKPRPPPHIELTTEERAAIMANGDNFRYNFVGSSKGAALGARELRSYPLPIYVKLQSGQTAYYQLDGSTSMLEIAKMLCADPAMLGAPAAAAAGAGAPAGAAGFKAELDDAERPPRVTPSDIFFVFAGRRLDRTRCFCAESGIQRDTTIHAIVRTPARVHVQSTVAEVEAAAERDKRAAATAKANCDAKDALTRVLLNPAVASGRAVAEAGDTAAGHANALKAAAAADGKTAPNAFESATAPDSAAAKAARAPYGAAVRSAEEWARLNAVSDNTKWWQPPAPRDAAVVAAERAEAAAVKLAAASGAGASAAAAGAGAGVGADPPAADAVPAAVLGKLTAYPLTLALSHIGRGVVATLQLNGTSSVGDVARALATDPALFGPRTGANAKAYAPPPPDFFRFVFAGRVLPHDRCFCGESGVQSGTVLHFAVDSAFAKANAPYYAARAADPVPAAAPGGPPAP